MSSQCNRQEVAINIRAGLCEAPGLSLLESVPGDGSAARRAASVHSNLAATAAGVPE